MKNAAMGGQVTFYWDLFFLLNFIMNIFLIGMTGLLRRKYIIKKRLFLASLAGSIQMTVAVGIGLVLSVRSFLIGKMLWMFFPLALLIGWEMLQIAFREGDWTERWRNFRGLVQVSVLTGGFLFLLRGWLWGYVHAGTGGVFVLAGTAGVFAVFVLGKREAGRRELQSHVMDGVLTARNGNTCSLRVLFDSGNGLVSPYTGEAVMIIDKRLAGELEIEKEQNPLWIPFHSIGGDGLLPAYRFQSLELQNGQRKENFLAAVSDNISADRTIQMILNNK